MYRPARVMSGSQYRDLIWIRQSWQLDTLTPERETNLRKQYMFPTERKWQGLPLRETLSTCPIARRDLGPGPQAAV